MSLDVLVFLHFKSFFNTKDKLSVEQGASKALVVELLAFSQACRLVEV